MVQVLLGFIDLIQSILLPHLQWFSSIFDRLSEALTKDSAKIKANIRMVLEVIG